MNDMTHTKSELIVCPVCPRLCRLHEGELGFCQARKAMNGYVIDENYGRITSLALDPIEKKPLARFMPGSKVLSIGSYGCNLRCGFCQNASIAWAGSMDVRFKTIRPNELVQSALEAVPDGNVGIAYTYNEPLVGYEYVRDCSRLAHESGLLNVLVSNGMINPGPLSEILPLIDAANIDLKGFTQGLYDQVGGDLDCVKATIEAFAKEKNCHLEVTTLIIPGLNDNPKQIMAASRWLASIDPDITYHITRFFPCHLFANRTPTPIEDVHRLADIARKYLPYVYVGNC